VVPFAVGGLLAMVLVAIAVLPLTVSAFAYARVEARNRRAWTSVGRPPVRLGDGPYRGVEIVARRLARAPLLVRAAGLACFYWAWFCLVAWIGLGLAHHEQGLFQLPVLGGILIAVVTWRTGVGLLRRDPRAVRFGRHVAGWTAAHATVVLALALALGGVDWSGPAVAFMGLSLGQAALVVAATRQHALLFGADAYLEHEGRRLPAWLALALSRRKAQRRANLLTRASHTMPGA